MKLGIISDTHGLLRPEVALALKGVDRILHLGDVGKPSILTELAKIAPVTAIRGNVDREGACGKLPETDVVLVEGLYIYMLHDLKTLHLDPAAANAIPEVRYPEAAAFKSTRPTGSRRPSKDPQMARSLWNRRKFAAVLHGHTHVPNFYTKKSVLYFNPGSCGPRRFELPVTVGLLTLGADGKLEAGIIPLSPG